MKKHGVWYGGHRLPVASSIHTRCTSGAVIVLNMMPRVGRLTPIYPSTRWVGVRGVYADTPTPTPKPMLTEGWVTCRVCSQRAMAESWVALHVMYFHTVYCLWHWPLPQCFGCKTTKRLLIYSTNQRAVFVLWQQIACCCQSTNGRLAYKQRFA